MIHALYILLRQQLCIAKFQNENIMQILQK